MIETPLELAHVSPLEPANQKIVWGWFEVAKEQQTHDGTEEDGEQQGATQGEGIRFRHRPEDLSLRAAHGEERNERTHHDKRGENQRALHFRRGAENPSLQREFPVVIGVEMPVDVLNHDHGRIDDDPEVHRPNGEQVGRLAANIEDAESEQEGQRYVDGDDQSAAHVAEKHEQDTGNQKDSKEQVLADRLRCDPNELGPVVVALDLHTRGQQARRRVEVVDLGFNVAQGGQGLFVLAELNDALDGIIVVLKVRGSGGIGFLPWTGHTDAAKPSLPSGNDANVRPLLAGRPGASVHDVVNTDRDVVRRGQDDLTKFLHSTCFLTPEMSTRCAWVVHRQRILHRVHAPTHKAQVSNHLNGGSLGKVVSVGVGVAIRDGRLKLIQRDPVATKAVWIWVNRTASRSAVPGQGEMRTRRNSRSDQSYTLSGRSVWSPIVARAGEDVAIDFSSRRSPGNLGDHALRQSHHRQAIDDLLPCLVVIEAVFELTGEVGEAEQRLSPVKGQSRHPGKRHFQRHRHQPLHFLRRSTRALGNHLDDGRSWVGIGFDVHVPEGNGADAD